MTLMRRSQRPVLTGTIVECGFFVGQLELQHSRNDLKLNEYLHVQSVSAKCVRVLRLLTQLNIKDSFWTF